MAASQLRSVTATSSYVALASIPASRVSILNNGTTNTLLIEMAGDSGTGKEVTIPTGGSVVIGVVANANEIRIKSSSGTTGVSIVIDN
jgi:hypothetical protein